MNKETINAIQDVISLGASAVSEASRHLYVAFYEYIVYSSLVHLIFGLISVVAMLFALHKLYKVMVYRAKKRATKRKVEKVFVEPDGEDLVLGVGMVVLAIFISYTISPIKEHAVKLLTPKAQVIIMLKDFIKTVK